MLLFPSDNITLVQVNQQIFRSLICKNCFNFKQNYHANYKQENHGVAYYTKIYFMKDGFQGAPSQILRNSQNKNSHETGLKTFCHRFLTTPSYSLSLTITSVYILLVQGFPQVLGKWGWALQNLIEGRELNSIHRGNMGA